MTMNIRLLMLPVIGAVIGYATNWIAVKMLFYPHYEKKLFGRRLPFTPGVIPKGQKRLARAAGDVIRNQLLNEEIMRSVLLSETMKTRIYEAIALWKKTLGTYEDKMISLPVLESLSQMNDREADQAEGLDDIREEGWEENQPEDPGEAWEEGSPEGPEEVRDPEAEVGQGQNPDEGWSEKEEGQSRDTEEGQTEERLVRIYTGVTVRQLVDRYVGEDQAQSMISQTQDRLSDHISRSIMAMDPASMLVDKLMEEARAMLAESMLGMMFGSSLLEKIGKHIHNKADDFIKEHLYDYISKMVSNESRTIGDKTVLEIIDRFEQESGPVEGYVWDLFTYIINTKLREILESIDFSQIVQDRINGMKPEQVEELVLYIMEKELSAVVNIGALIGFVLGLLNILILRLPL